MHSCITIYVCQTDPVYRQTASSPWGVPLILLATLELRLAGPIVSGHVSGVCMWCVHVHT